MGEDMDAKSAGRSELEKTHSVEDTGALLAAINHGKGLKAAQPSIPTRQSPAPSMQQQQQQQQNRAPAAIKTNIKAANQGGPGCYDGGFHPIVLWGRSPLSSLNPPDP